MVKIEGKEVLLQAIAAVCTACHGAISSNDPTTPNSVLTLVASACSKKDKKFREAALNSLEEIIKAFRRQEFFNLAFPQLHEMCCVSSDKNAKATLASGSEKTDSEADKREDTSASHNKILDCITSCVQAASISDILLQQQPLMDVISNSLSPSTTWTVKLSGFSLIRMLCTRMNETALNALEDSLHAGVTSFVHELFFSVSPKILECITIVKIGQVHVAAAECLQQVSELCKAFQPKLSKEVEFKSELIALIDVEKNEQAKSLLKGCLVTLEAIERDRLAR